MSDLVESHARQRPNIVFIMADQLGANFIGSYGSGVDSTPHLDSLAAEGTRFDRFYATSPVCAPNRATILTGRSPEIHGIITNNLALQTDNPTYAHVLRQQGYRTGCFGKIHQTPMHWPPPAGVGFLGFDESIISEDPKWGPWIDWVKEHHPDHYETAIAMTNGHSGLRGATWLEPSMGASKAQFQLKAEVYNDIMAPRLDASAWDRMYASPLPAEVHDTVFITDCGLDFMQRMVASRSDQPFLCHISYVDPHDPYDPPEPYASMFSPDDMPNPLPAEWLEQGPALLESNRDSYLKFRTICDDVAAIKQLRALYHGSIKLIDDQIGRIVDYLKATGLWETTIFVFTTDHGDMMGDHGLITKGMPHYDTGVRCPLIVAGGAVREGVTDRLSCSLDLFPTFCSWAQVPADAVPPCEGSSFAAQCTGIGADGLEPGAGWEEIAISIGGVDSVITDDGWRLTRFSPQNAYDVAAYIWPAYTGNEPRTRMFWPEGNGEWESVRKATAKFQGHNWPRRPLWGYCNEADPEVMEMQIDAAADHGVNVFIYDWYWYDNRPFLEHCLNDGYLKARNNDRVKFYLMWANHDVAHMGQAAGACGTQSIIWQAAVNRPV
jgi:arylsulfatase